MRTLQETFAPRPYIKKVAKINILKMSQIVVSYVHLRSDNKNYFVNETYLTLIWKQF